MNCFRYIHILLVLLYPNLVLAQSSDAASDVRELMKSRDQKIKQLLDNEGTNSSANQRDELKDTSPYFDFLIQGMQTST